MSRDPREDEIRGALRTMRPPGEDDALERAVALAAAEGRGRASVPPRRRLRAVLAALAAAGAAAALALTPAGADVRGWVADAIDDDPPIEEGALMRLPGGGRALVDSRAGSWLVSEDGSRRLLGGFEASTFSPNGLFVGATRGNQLSALEPDGRVRWSISRPARLADPRWAPSGYRIAFREGRSLAVVAGDGTEPRAIAAAAPVAPSWRPPADDTQPELEPNVLTYVHPSGSLATIDVDTGRLIWRWAGARDARAVVWAGPDRLAVSLAHSVRLLDRSGEPVGSVPLPDDAQVESVTPSPDGERLAIVLAEVPAFNGSEAVPSRLHLARITSGERRERTVFSGFGRFGQPAFSPGGDWILLPWLDTDQWLFINPSEDRKLLRRVVAVGDISRQFDPGGRGRSEAPVVTGWCCAGD
jgi:hypothetical protein